MNHVSGTASGYSAQNFKDFLKELNRSIRGEIRFDKGSRALYSTDSSNYRQVPAGVVIPRNQDDIVETVRLCYKYKIPITSRGTGTSLAGQTTNETVIIDYSKYFDKILFIDPDKKLATVQPGVVLDDLQRALQPHYLLFGPDPSTHESCTIGGMIGNNACGVHSVLSNLIGEGPRTSDNLHSLKILTSDGQILTVGETRDDELETIIRKKDGRGRLYKALKDLIDKYGDLVRNRYPNIPRRVSGYNLDDLLPEKGFNVARALAGSEGTCVIILEATLKLVPKSREQNLVVVGFPDVYKAGDHVPRLLHHNPESLEGMDNILIDLMKKKGLHLDFLPSLPKGKGWLMAEFGGKTMEEANEKAEKAVQELQDDPGILEIVALDDHASKDRIWKIRESGLGATAHVLGEKDAWEGWEDSAAPPEKIGDYMRDLRKLLMKYNYGCTFYGHFGEGIVHTRIEFGLKSTEGIRKFRTFLKEAAQLVVRYGGSLSGEHGDGQSRGELLEIMFGKELVEVFGKFKEIWDPRNIFNPRKIVNPYRVDENLRYGPAYNPPQWPTQFSYPDDKGSFSYALERCVGVGKCRKTESGTMCPSYMVTQEEKHSTRGRARLLFEMMQGSVIGKKAWKEKAVAEALDFCLACKACKSECPVSVDMATYKAEFRYHYYKGRFKPMAAYAMGLIDMWAGLASAAPGSANFMMQKKPFGPILKNLAGLAPQREMPRFARQTFRKWFNKRKDRKSRTKKVILWADTFNNFFLPQTARAAVRTLEKAGFEVVVPRRKLCCGRPLYDFGMLDRARGYLQRILKTLKPEIEAGIPIVGLEPSCVSVFRDELVNLFPNVEDAKRLSSKVMTFGEFLEKEASGFQPPKLNRRALVHGHCHHRAIMGVGSELRMLDKLGLDYELLDSGCCGMAGAFGFEKDNYDVSVACGERVLAPKIREAAKDVLLIANGFSCREQIESLTGRKAMHLAEVIEMALEERSAVADSELVKT